MFKTLLKHIPISPVYAHCDIPCGIYDPKPAQIAAATILKMMEKISEITSETPSAIDRANFVRFVWTKEEHARKCKEELLILWTDYFKEEHLEKFPDLHNIFWKTTKLCSKVKQTLDLSLARELVESVDQIAEIFNQTKK